MAPLPGALTESSLRLLNGLRQLRVFLSSAPRQSRLLASELVKECLSLHPMLPEATGALLENPSLLPSAHAYAPLLLSDPLALAVRLGMIPALFPLATPYVARWWKTPLPAAAGRFRSPVGLRLTLASDSSMPSALFPMAALSVELAVVPLPDVL